MTKEEQMKHKVDGRKDQCRNKWLLKIDRKTSIGLKAVFLFKDKKLENSVARLTKKK